MLDESKMRRTILHVLSLIVSRQYEALAEFDSMARLTPEILREAIEEWPEKGDAHHFIMPPTDDIYQLVMEGGFEPIPGVMPEEWQLEVYLWTIEQGRSELSLRLVVFDAPGEFYRVEVWDILVM